MGEINTQDKQTLETWLVGAGAEHRLLDSGLICFNQWLPDSQWWEVWVVPWDQKTQRRVKKLTSLRPAQRLESRWVTGVVIQ